MTSRDCKKQPAPQLWFTGVQLFYNLPVQPQNNETLIYLCVNTHSPLPHTDAKVHTNTHMQSKVAAIFVYNCICLSILPSMA